MNSQKVKEKKIIISGARVELTEAIKNKVNEKCDKIYEHSEDILKIRVILDKEGATGIYTSTGILEIYGPQIVCTGKDEDLYKAIGKMSDNINRQLRIKSRKRKHRQHAES